MGETTAEFFEALRSRGHEPLLHDAKGVLRFELADGSQTATWVVSVDHGDVAVSTQNGNADCTVRCKAELFDRLARGETNAMAAFLRGAVTAEGDPTLLMLFQRLFPGPAAGR